jgi:hypothetical protein
MSPPSSFFLCAHSRALVPRERPVSRVTITRSRVSITVAEPPASGQACIEGLAGNRMHME